LGGQFREYQLLFPHPCDSFMWPQVNCHESLVFELLSLGVEFDIGTEMSHFFRFERDELSYSGNDFGSSFRRCDVGEESLLCNHHDADATMCRIRSTEFTEFESILLGIWWGSILLRYQFY
jgi:hypothetical protein